MKQLASVRTNLSFSIEDSKRELHSMMELVLLTYKKEYDFDSKGYIKEKKGLDETRIILSSDGLNQLIAKLQLAANQLQQYDQMAINLNNVIEAMIVKNNKDV